MSLRLAALDAYTALTALLCPGWLGEGSKRIDRCFMDLETSRNMLRSAIGDALVSGVLESDETLFDDVSLIFALADRLERRQETKILGLAIQAAIRQHEAALTTTPMPNSEIRKILAQHGTTLSDHVLKRATE